MYSLSANLLIEVGSVLIRPWGLKSSGVVFPLTDYHAHLQIRSSADAGGDPILDADDQEVGGLAIDASAGTITLTVLPEVSAALDLSGLPVGPLQVRKTKSGAPVVVTGPRAVFAMEVTPPGGPKFRLLDGQVVFSPEVVHG